MSGMIGNTEDSMYIGTFQGKFIIRVADGTEGAVQRKNKNGVTVTEIQFNKLVVKLYDIKEREHEEYGTRIQFYVYNEEDGKKAILETSQGSNLFSAIVNRLPNMDLSKPIEIVSRYNPEKERSLYFIKQNGQDIEDKFQVYDKDKGEWKNLHDFPKWEETIVNNKKVWDKTKQIIFQKKVIAKLYDQIIANTPTSVHESPDIADEPEEEDIQWG